MCKDFDTIYPRCQKHRKLTGTGEPEKICQVQPQFLLVILSVALLGESLVAMRFSIASMWFHWDIGISMFFSGKWSANAEF